MRLVLAVNVAFGVIAALIGQASSAMEWIILVSMAVASLGVLRVKVLLPSIAFARKLVRGVDILLELPAWVSRIEARLHELEHRNER